MLDLSRMNKVLLSLHTSPAVISVGGGCTWAAVDAALQPHGLAVPAGCFIFPNHVNACCLLRIPDFVSHPFVLCAAATLHSLALSGLISHTGVGGLTLGGGVGFTSRLLGLTCDALVGARVVTSSGKVVVVDERTHSDLFWVKPQRIVRMTLFRAHGCSCNASSMPCDT